MIFERRTAILMLLALPACGRKPAPAVTRQAEPGLYPNETPELRALINEYAAFHDIPASLIHRVIQRESDYRPRARNGPYWGMMQILPETARTMGHRGPPSELLDPEVTLRYAGKYLRGAWLVSDGDEARAVMWYARGYYFEARDRCMLVETGLLNRELCGR
ncbi:transglycosylase SLT domain-containing protein [Yoonia sp. R2331]|uniref:transglycosylase SLT domain-containing protein n=1 Tax=Yoonia sp. R2331 TaxID=3237238 RepID=UPI0034E61AFF